MGLKTQKKTKDAHKRQALGEVSQQVDNSQNINYIQPGSKLNQTQQDNEKYDAFPEDLMFLHIYDDKLYGYRQNKCFCFSRTTLQLLDVFDADFNHSFYSGCPVYKGVKGNYGITSDSNTIYNFYAHSIHEVHQMLGSRSFNLQRKQYQYACTHEGFLLFNSENKIFMLLNIKTGELEYKLLSLGLIGNSFEMVRVDYNYILILNTQNPQQIHIYDIAKETILDQRIHLNVFNTTPCISANIYFFHSQMLILSYKNPQLEEKLLLLEIYQLPNKCNMYQQLNQDQYNQLDSGLVIDISGIEMLLSPYVTDSNYRKTVFSEVLYKVFGATVTISDDKTLIPQKKQPQLYSDQQFKDLLLEIDYLTEYNKIKIENQEQEIAQLKSMIITQNTRIQKLESDNKVIQDMFKHQQSINEQLAKQIQALNVRLKHGIM